ncbi:UNVERIFIED_CONTAM: Retrovirus-related Pol polyprotein from transposon.6 [Sesamum radiatum]|uniref:Retrovirus-related Pol polyprotein from transposon.6 n=1 Tax=Sesamum radiatum TaxID=300843 RepID=A0AAW2JU35_SESRA
MPPKSTQALEEAITTLLDSLSELHVSMELRHDSLVAVVSDIQQHLAAIPTPVTSFSSPAALPPLPPPVAAKPPSSMQLFDGSAVLDWVFQAEQYFAFYQIPVSQRLDAISFYMKGEALRWFKWMFTNRQLSSRDVFVRDLELRFGPSSFDNHQAMLFKLRQRGSVAEFQAEFERLCNRVGVAPPSASAPPDSVDGPTFSTCDCLAPLSRGAPGTAYQGPLFNCDEKFGPGHRCKAKQFMLLLSDDPPDFFDSCPDLEDVPLSLEAALTDGVLFQLSPAAVSGSSSPRTLCLRGLIRGHAVSVLIDSGNSHNIIQPRVAPFLSLAESSLPSFPVLIGNGAALHCSGVCHDVSLLLQSHNFSVSLYVILIFGADIVLGVQWLNSLGPFLSDFSVPSTQFAHNGNWVTLTSSPRPPRGLHPSLIPPFSVHSYPPDIRPLRDRYTSVFSVPSGLPPHRPQDHNIHLLPNQSPMNIKPYRYPHFQKDIMTQMITDMLQEGIITPSTSPISSSILLDHKKDGTWRFCVDYRALNAVTVPDRFPIPTVDELLDELHGASVLSKLDLRAGYHQIRVAPEDTYKKAFRTVDGHFEFLVMPFGLSNAPSTFQSVMNDLFRPFLCRFVLVFFDDILIYSNSWSSHLAHLDQVLLLLQDNYSFAKLSKCTFGVATVDYLGHVISTVGVAADPAKFQAIADLPPPRSLTKLRAFLDLTRYYHRYVQHYTAIAGPLTDLLKGRQHQWPPTAAAAFTAPRRPCCVFRFSPFRISRFLLTSPRMSLRS